ncbi:FecR domain-containing protein [Pigmentiphaga daeguensis]|uniref:FecR family protein n=1 Tax=Pigmentiphaga daeguensis TaxID=414049 RepID=A0ABN1BS57_9BURK
MAQGNVYADEIAARALDPSVVEQAADWLVRLEPGGDGADYEACRRWRAEKPEHELAWQRMADLHAGMRQSVQRIDRRAATVAIGQGVDLAAKRRRALKWLAGIAGVGTVTWAGRDALPWRSWTAQHHTAAGERQTLVLEDGTSLLLNTRTAVDVRYDSRVRRVVLIGGEIQVTTGRDRRPFHIETRTGRIRPIGTRFTVRNLDSAPGRTQVAVLEGSAMLEPSAGSAPLLVRAGQQASFTATSTQGPAAAGPTAGAWVEGVLAAQAMRLEDFLEELGRYRTGVLTCSRGIADLRITGVFPLADTDQVLQSLEHIFRVKVVRRTRYWVTVVAA